MKSISAWFDRHMKTRIALQLVLDGLPFLLSLSFLVIMAGLNDGLKLPFWLGKFVIVCSFTFLLASIPLVVMSIWMRYRIENRIKGKLVRLFSTMLEILSCIVTVLFLPLRTSFIHVIIANLF